jgi:phosphatidylglycerophosphate synthase
MNNKFNNNAEFVHMSRPVQLFPLIRQISYQLSPLLAKHGLSPNQVTMTGLVAGIFSAFAFAQGTHGWGMTGALLWAICSLMDYCDGEVARITGKFSHYGAIFDDIVDWIVHASFFTGLGLGAVKITGDTLWLWLGLFAAAGSTFNTWMNWLRLWFRYRQGLASPRIPGETILPSGWKEISGCW